jgi:23S rRNA (guanosine2251-2'-O)-methyltransferase
MNIICGINPVLEALSSGTRHFDRLLVAKGLRNRRLSEAVRLASQRGVPLRFETRETLDRIAGDVPHQGLVAVVSAKPVMGLEALLEQVHPPALLVVLDGVEDPRNLGAILRTAEAAGVDGVVLPERHTAGLSETVARASAGGLEHVRVARVGNVAQALEALKERGLWIVGFDAAGTERWDAVDLRRPVVLVFGGEGRGIRRLVREKCDHLASLPLFGHVGSLNVSVVAGIALYEAVRQRGAVPSHVRPIPPADAPRPVPDARAEATWSEEEDEDGRGALVLIEEHDSLAWSPPVVLNHVGPRHKGRGRRDDRRLHARPKAEAKAPPAPPAAGERPRQGPPGRRRRRKGRHRPDGGAAQQRGGGGEQRRSEGASPSDAPRPEAGPGGRETPHEHRAAGAAEDAQGGENRPRRGRTGRRRHRRRRRPPVSPADGS